MRQSTGAVLRRHLGALLAASAPCDGQGETGCDKEQGGGRRNLSYLVDLGDRESAKAVGLAATRKAASTPVATARRSSPTRSSAPRHSAASRHVIRCPTRLRRREVEGVGASGVRPREAAAGVKPRVWI